MSGKNSRLNPLETRKKLLIAESELNRARMQEDWQAMTDGVRSLTERAKSFGVIASSAAALVAGVAALRCGRAGDGDVKPSWMKSVLKGAGLISNLWLAFRPPGRREKDN